MYTCNNVCIRNTAGYGLNARARTHVIIAFWSG